MRHRGSRGVRRRKPVVVIGVAAAGLLVAGGIVATRAGAEERSSWPDVPGLSLSDLPGFSGFGDDSGDSDGGSAVASGLPAGVAAGDDSGGAGASDPVSPVDGAPAADRPRVVRGPGGAHPDPAPPARADSGGDGDAADHRRSDSVPAGAAHAVPEMPDPPKAGAVPARPRPDFLRQDAGDGLIAAAKENVTAADVSESPNAPVQQQILTLINDNRRAHGCGSVTLDRRLIEAANGHAADMARHDYFAHESPDGQGAGDRVTDAGYNWKHYGENIARGVDSAYAVVDGWMHSPEHRHNILDCTLEQMGVGIAIAGDRTVYWVQDFATPM